MLNALPKDQLLVLDLFCEYKENWRKRNQFGNTPWLWCTIHNFGGNNGIVANFDRIVNGPVAALNEAGPGKGQMKGLGALMEGSETSPMLWDMFFSQGWRREAPGVEGWIKDYARRRYGADSADAVEALNILRRTAYSVPGGHGQFPHNSAVCARPSLNPNQKARAFTGTTPAYDTTEFAKGWQALLRAAPVCGGSDGYRYDVVDFGRQALEDLGTRYHKAICAAWKAKDRKALELYSEKMLSLINGMDDLTGSRKEFLFGVWQRDARAWGATEEESDLCEENARALLTTWTVPQCWGDYANRQWSGLLKGFYLHRWEEWLRELKAGADNNWNVDVKGYRSRILKWEYSWVRQHETYTYKPVGDEIKIAKQLFAEFGADALNPQLYKAPAGKVLSDVKPADFYGRWEYKAGGLTYVREMLPDGTLKLYRNGKPFAGWKGYTWKLKGNTVELHKANGRVFGRHLLRDKNTLIFKGEHWGPAKKL
jgi:alpha-N-acetylglucosaminidase